MKTLRIATLLLSFIFFSQALFAQNNQTLASNLEDNTETKTTVQESAPDYSEVQPTIQPDLSGNLQPNIGINYLVKENGFVSLKIFDIKGNEIATLVNRDQEQGTYFTNYSAMNLKKGIYTYKVSVDNKDSESKLLFVE